MTFGDFPVVCIFRVGFVWEGGPRVPLVVIIRRGGSLLLATLGGVERVGWRADPLAAHKMLLRGLVSILNRGGRL